MQAVEEQQSLTREQKEAVGLLSIGTFLEYFDLMLYVHMAVLLNELFFPESDSQNTESKQNIVALQNHLLEFSINLENKNFPSKEKPP